MKSDEPEAAEHDDQHTRPEQHLPIGRTRVVAMLDLFNTLNSNQVSNFQIVNGASFNRIVATLDPRTVMTGIRFEF